MITPCIAICKIDSHTKVCTGCNRTVEQITNWKRYTDEQRLEVMKTLGYGKRRGGRDRNESERIDLGKS